METSDHEAPQPPVKRFRRRGPRVWKLMVLVAVIGVFCWLVAAVNTAREAARAAMCRNLFEQIGLALHNYQSAKRVPPAGDARGCARSALA